MKMNSLLDAALHQGALPRLAGRGRGGPQRPRDLRSAAGRSRGLGEHPGRLDRRALPRALPDLLVRAPRRAPDLHRLGRPDAAQPLQPGRAAHAGRGPGQPRPAHRRPRPRFADNTNSWELGSDGVWSRRTPNGERARSLQGELIELHAERAEEAARRARLAPHRPPCRRSGSLAAGGSSLGDHKDSVYLRAARRGRRQHRCGGRAAASTCSRVWPEDTGLARDILKAEQEGDRITQEIVRAPQRDPS